MELVVQYKVEQERINLESDSYLKELREPTDDAMSNRKF
jgi:hypothetical protein